MQEVRRATFEQVYKAQDELIFSKDGIDNIQMIPKKKWSGLEPVDGKCP